MKFKNRCELVDAGGTRCPNLAVDGTKFCRKHQPPKDAKPKRPPLVGIGTGITGILNAERLLKLGKDAWEEIQKIFSSPGGPPDSPSPEVPDFPNFPGALSPQQIKLISQLPSTRTKAERKQILTALLASLSRQEELIFGVAILAIIGASQIRAEQKATRSDA